jgi:probable F420-dependent oxidoreductase
MPPRTAASTSSRARASEPEGAPAPQEGGGGLRRDDIEETRVSRPFRFGVQAYRAQSASEWREIAQRVEGAGYSTLHVADHYIGPGPVGARMLNVGYHVPAVLAKEVASIDVLSDGRLELGLGAGWLSAEYEAMGIPFASAGDRITLLEETVQLISQVCAGAMVDVSGRYVSAHDYTGVPATPQSPRPPIMIGGGAPRILRYAGSVADIVSINFNNRSGQVGADSIATSTGEETRSKLGWVREGAHGAGRELPELEIAAYFTAVTGVSEIGADALSTRTGLSSDELRRFPHALVGDVGEIVEELQRRREEYGFSYVTVGDAHLDAFAPVVAALAGT